MSNDEELRTTKLALWNLRAKLAYMMADQFRHLCLYSGHHTSRTRHLYVLAVKKWERVESLCHHKAKEYMV